MRISSSPPPPPPPPPAPAPPPAGTEPAPTQDTGPSKGGRLFEVSAAFTEKAVTFASKGKDAQAAHASEIAAHLASVGEKIRAHAAAHAEQKGTADMERDEKHKDIGRGHPKKWDRVDLYMATLPPAPPTQESPPIEAADTDAGR